jgi:hypothetical protein
LVKPSTKKLQLNPIASKVSAFQNNTIERDKLASREENPRNATLEQKPKKPPSMLEKYGCAKIEDNLDYY